MSRSPSARLLHDFDRVSAAAAITALGLGVLVLAGWALHIPSLKSVVPGLPTMKANTAVAFALAGLALACLRPGGSSTGASRLGYVLAVGVTSIGVFTLMEYALGWDLLLDRLLFADPPGSPGTLYPGRMGMATAAAFTLSGLSLLFLNTPTAAGWTSVLGAIAGAVGLFSALGYLYHAGDPGAMAAYTQMALHTSLGFIALAVGIVCARPDQGLLEPITSPQVGGTTARMLLPAAFVLPPTLGGIGWLCQRAGLYGTEYGLAIFTFLNVCTFAGVIWVTANVMNGMDRRRRDAEGKLHDLNAELDARVRRRTAQLESAVKELEAFSYSVSHDLRAPLRAIDGFSRIVLEEHASQIDEEGRRFLSLVRSNTQSMAQLIDDLLGFSRLNRAPLTKVPVQPERLVEQTWDELYAERDGREIQLQVGELPGAHAEPTLLKQVFHNLLSNAIKFTGPRDPAVIQVGARPESGHTVFFVRDNGVGFDPQYADKVFGVFQRLHRAEEFEGTGVGLALVQRIVHRHGGRIWAESRPGQGTTFYFTLQGEHQYEPDADHDPAGRDLAGRGQPE